MRFCDIVPDSDGYLLRINFCRIAAGNVNMAVWEPEVHFRKSAKSRMPESIVSDYKQPRSKMQYGAQKHEIVVVVVVVVVVHSDLLGLLGKWVKYNKNYFIIFMCTYFFLRLAYRSNLLMEFYA